MEQMFKNADIGILSKFLTIFPNFFNQFGYTLANAIHMPSFRPIGPSIQKLGGGGRICPLMSTPICKTFSIFTPLRIFCRRIEISII